MNTEWGCTSEESWFHSRHVARNSADLKSAQTGFWVNTDSFSMVKKGKDKVIPLQARCGPEGE
jgi:hypothetical protein